MRWKFWQRSPISLSSVIQDLNSSSPTAISRGLHSVLRNPQLFRPCQAQITELFSHSSAHIRWFAAKVAAQTGGDLAAEALAINLLKDGWVAVTTAQLLVNLGGRAVPALKRFLWHEAVRENPQAIQRALKVLVAIDDNPVHTLFAMLSSHTKQFIIDEVLVFGEEAMPILIDGYRNDERGEADAVVEVLAKLGDLGFHWLIDLLLERPKPAKRRLLVDALSKKTGSYFDPSFFTNWRAPDELLDLLADLTQDEDERTTLVAAWLIRELLPFASAEKREQIETAMAFILMGGIQKRLRAALEKGMQPRGQGEELLLIAA